jgi:AraC-like DNA-binding protein
MMSSAACRRLQLGESCVARISVTPSTIRAFFAAPMIRELNTGGVPIDSFLRSYGLSSRQLTSLYECIPLRQFAAMAEDAAARLRRPYLGLELGENFALADLGPFYATFLLVGDLQSALTSLSRFQSAWQTNTTLECVRGETTSVYRYRIQDPSIWPRCQDAEFAVASFTTFIRELAKRGWRPLAVEFEHDLSGREARLQEFFKAPVYGNREVNQLIIANVDLDKPLRGHFDANTQNAVAILERHLMELLSPPRATDTESASARVNELVGRRLGSAEVTFEAIAVQMNMSVRSLRRHLTAEGTSFREILKAHRRTAVESALHGQAVRLSGLADRLSYSDPSALSRAFKNWTGQSPREYAKSRKR